MKRTIPYFLLLTVLAVGCTPSRDKLARQIDAQEKSLYSPQAQEFSKGKADSLVAMYEEFIQKHPQDTLSPGYLFKAGNIVMNEGDGPKALRIFEQYMKDYPKGPKAALCLFFKAFIYENLMGDLDRAKESYLIFLEKYPNDDFANDARMSIANLGKTPEMLIKEFEARQKADSLAKSGKK
ncbi:MAG TPA: tetratricopeptide repeat protein [Bacteroidales bacterium]|nr:tetratricopeptide repeat protein [Bacteroidales bacterium]HPS63009.1 tetratricopeptide repeat protein [Bacteroidales bacterium]